VRTDPDKTWAMFRFPTDHFAQVFFDASVSVEIGDGSRALFWEDNWLAGCSVKLLAPNLWAAVSPRVRRSRTIQEGLSTGPCGIRWVTDITHARTVQVIVQFLSIWDLVRAVRLSPVPDRFVWKWSPNGIYSSSSAYAALFLGRVDILGARQIWKTQMPGKCKFFAWLVLHGRCWTSDRLHHHGLKESDSCALCAQAVETLDHLLVDCVYSRETWFRTIGHILLPQLALDRPMSLAA
jgi:hypothetical protein